MEEKKFELTDETVKCGEHILHRIKALKNFGHIAKGDLGGYVEKEENLSQEYECWVYGNAKVYGDAYVSDFSSISSNAKIFDNAMVYDHAVITDFSIISDNAKVYGNARIHDHAVISGNSQVYNRSIVSGDANIGDNARIYDDARVCYNAWVYGNAKVFERAQVGANQKVCGNTQLGGVIEEIGVHLTLALTDFTSEELRELFNGNNKVMNVLLKKKLGKTIGDFRDCYISSDEIDYMNEYYDLGILNDEINFFPLDNE